MGSYAGASNENWNDIQGLLPSPTDSNVNPPHPPDDSSITPGFIITTPTGQGQVDPRHGDIFQNTGLGGNQVDWNDEPSYSPFSPTDGPFPPQQRQDEGWTGAQVSGPLFSSTDGPFLPQQQQDNGWTDAQVSGSSFSSPGGPFSAQQRQDEGWGNTQTSEPRPFSSIGGALFSQRQQDGDWRNSQASGSQPFSSADSARSTQQSSSQGTQVWDDPRISEGSLSYTYLHPHTNYNIQETYSIGPSTHAGSNYLRNSVGFGGQSLRATETPRRSKLQGRAPGGRAKSLIAASHQQSPRFEPYPSAISGSSFDIPPYSAPGPVQGPVLGPVLGPVPSESDYAPSAVHSAPGGSAPVQFIPVQPNRDGEIEEVAAEFLSITLYNGPVTAGTQSYGTKSIEAVHEAHHTIFNRPSTKTLSETPDDATIGRILAVAGLLIGRLVSYVRKRFPTDWKIDPPASKGYAVGSEAYKQYQISRINQYTNELNFTKAEPGTELRDNDYPLFNHPALYDGFADYQWTDRLLGPARPGMYRRMPPYHLLALYIAIVLHRFACELAIIQKEKVPSFGEQYDYVSTIVIAQLNQITNDQEKKTAFLKYLKAWAVEGHARYIKRGKQVKKRTRKAVPRVQITAGVDVSALP